MLQKLTILVWFVLLILGYFFPYFIGISSFPIWGDFAAYYLEYSKYHTSGKLYELISVWYEPWYFMYLNILERLTDDFQLSFLISEIVILILYFFSLYFFLWVYTKLSFRKKIIVSFLFIFSISQLLPFIFSLRKQYFCWPFLILYLAILGRKLLWKTKIFLLGLLMAMLFFTHRWIAFYGVIFLVTLFLKPKQNFNLIVLVSKSVLIWLIINIAYLTPFLLIQLGLIQDTFTLFLNNAQVAINGTGTNVYKSRWLDMYQWPTDNTWVSYFFGESVIFLYLFSLLKFIWKDKFFIYFTVLNLFIYLWAVMAGRLWHVAIFLAIYFFWQYLCRHKKLLILFFPFFLFPFVSQSFQWNMNNRYFSVIDDYLQNFYDQVPRENTFMVSINNPFLRYSGYKSEYSFTDAILRDTYSAYKEKWDTTNMLVDFRSLFFLYWYKEVILPESLRGYDIYVVFGYFTENYLSPEARKYFLNNRISSKNFLNSPLYELVSLNGGKSRLNNYKWYYPINFVFRLKKWVSIRYVPDNEIVSEALRVVHSSY